MIPTILIVDDSSSIHHLVSSFCLGEPWHVCSAYSGLEALNIAGSRGAELVLLDVDLPDINGFDICRSLRSNPQTARSAVIFLTAASSIDEKVCGLQLGAFDYVTKPFTPAELVERVRNALRAKRLIDLIPEPPAQGNLSGTTKGFGASGHRNVKRWSPDDNRRSAANGRPGHAAVRSPRAM